MNTIQYTPKRVHLKEDLHKALEAQSAAVGGQITVDWFINDAIEKYLAPPATTEQYAG